MADRTRKPRPAAGDKPAKAKASRKAGGRAPTGANTGRTRKAAPSTRKGGRQVVDLHAPVGYVQVPGPDGELVRKPLSIIEQAAQTFRYFGRWADAAAKCGMHVDTLRGYVEHGAKVRRNRLAGEIRLGDLTAHDRQCVELLEAVEQAEADGRLMMLGVLHRGAQGYQLPPKVKERRDADGKLITREVITEHAQPNITAATWLLERTFPDEWGRTRLEVTGKDGEPLVDVSDPLAKINAMLDTIAANTAEAPTADELASAAAPMPAPDPPAD